MEITSSGEFANVYKTFLKELSLFFDKSNKYDLLGSKEIIAEEYIPYFLEKKIKTILIIRDPRDIITSLNFGNGKEHMGEIRPTLFSLRNWRKSVAFAIEYQNHENFLCIKYEDLIKDKSKHIKKIFSFLGLENNVINTNEIVNQQGGIWKGNSSHTQGNKIKLDTKTTEYIETICFPELNFMRYETKSTALKTNWQEIIKKFKEPLPITHNLFSSNYSTTNENIENEINRLSILKNKEITTDLSKWFIFDSAYHQLKF